MLADMKYDKGSQELVATGCSKLQNELSNLFPEELHN